jgi:hypothetical protein
MGRRNRRPADEKTETTTISDEASLWWTRGDFVKHAVIRQRSGTGGTTEERTRRTPSAAGSGPGRSPSVDRPTDGDDRPFAERFPTESLYAPGPGAPRRAATGTHASRPQPMHEEPAPVVTAPARPRIAANHPLAGALHSLGLDGEATWSDVQQAYRARAKDAHPDRSGDDGEAMAELNATYASLRNGWRYGLFGDS